MPHEARAPKRHSRQRPVIAPTFGKYLSELRGTRSRGVICEELKRFGVELDRSTLLQYERGTVSAPDPAALWALGRLYRVSLDDLALVLLRDRTGQALAAQDLRPAAFSDRQLQIAQAFALCDTETQDLLLYLAGRFTGSVAPLAPRGSRPFKPLRADAPRERNR